MSDSIQRLLILRQFPGFADAELSELAAIAENVVATSLPAGSVVAQPGRLPALHLVIEGRIDTGDNSYGPRQTFGTLQAISGRALATPAIAAVPTRTLQLAAVDFADVLEDNFGLLSSVRRTLARELLAAGHRSHVRPRLPYTVRGESLGLVDRLVLLRHQITFATGSIQALAALAQSTREIRWKAGDLITRSGELATSSLVIIEGSLRMRGADDIRVFGPNEALGVVESLAESAYAATTEALTPVRALECPSVALFDVIEDHADLALSLIARLASELLDQDLAQDLAQDLVEPALARVN